jgi:hypothetical protein
MDNQACMKTEGVATLVIEAMLFVPHSIIDGI